MSQYEAVVMGVSAGGMRVLSLLVPALPPGLGFPIMVVQHRATDTDDFLARHLDRRSACTVKEAARFERATAGTVYLAPAGRHLSVAENRTLALSRTPRIRCSRPSIDVLFESAARVYGSGLVGILLTGANEDGVSGLQTVRQHGGLAVVQEPRTAPAPYLPTLAIDTVGADYVLPPVAIAELLGSLSLPAESQPDASSNARHAL